MRRVWVGAAVLLVAWILWLFVSGPTERRHVRAREGVPHGSADSASMDAKSAATHKTDQESPTAPSDPAAGPWRVRLLNGDRPLAGVRVTFARSEGKPGWAVTDASGWAAMGDVAVEQVAALPYLAPRQITCRETTIKLYLLPLEVVVKDVKTGVVVDGAAVTLVGDTRRVSLDAVGGGFRLSDAPLVRGASSEFELEIDPPPGFSAPGRVLFAAKVSRMANEVRIEVPLGPELRHTLRVVDADGHRVEGARIDWFRGMNVMPRYEPSDALGRIELRQLPYARNYTVRVSYRELAQFHVFGLWVPAAVWGSHELKPGPAETTVCLDVAQKFDRPSGWVDFDFATEDWNPQLGERTVTVRCAREDGAPAIGVAVVLRPDRSRAFTNASGVAVFHRPNTASGIVEVVDAGFLSPRVSFTSKFASDPANVVVVSESERRDIRIDIGNAGPPYLTQFFGSPQRVVDGVQVGGTFTNLDGHAVLEGVPVSKLKVSTSRGRLGIPAEVRTWSFAWPEEDIDAYKGRVSGGGSGMEELLAFR